MDIQNQNLNISNNESYYKRREEAKSKVFSADIYNLFQQLKEEKERQELEKHQEQIKTNLINISPANKSFHEFDEKIKTLSKITPYLSLLTTPWTSKKLLEKVGWIKPESKAHKFFYDPYYTPFDISGQLTPIYDALKMFFPLTAAISPGLYGARKLQQLSSVYKDRQLLGPSANTFHRYGGLSSLITALTTSPLLLKAGRQLPFIGGALGAGGDILSKLLFSTIWPGIGAAVKAPLSLLPKGVGSAIAGMPAGLMGSLTLALPSIISGISGIKLEFQKKKLIAIRHPASKYVKEYSLTGFVEPAMVQLIGRNQITPSDQLKILLLKLIADSVSPIPKLTEMTEYAEQQREKEVKVTKTKTLKELISFNSDDLKKGFFSKVGTFFDLLSVKSQRIASYSPITQLMNYIFAGKTPHDVRSELFEREYEIKHSDETKKEILNLSKKTGLNIEFLTLLNTSSVSLLKSTYGPEAIQTMLLSGIYELIRGYTKEWLFVVGKKADVSLKKPKLEETPYSNIPVLDSFIALGSSLKNLFGKVKQQDSYALIKDLLKKFSFGSTNTYTDIFKDYFNTKKSKAGAFVNKIKDKIDDYILGDLKEYKKDPKLLLRELGLFQTQQEKIVQYQAESLPDDIQTIIYYQKEQLNTLENILFANQLLLRQFNIKFLKQQIIKTENMKYDSITGKKYTKDQYDKLKKDREDQIKDYLKSKMGSKTNLKDLFKSSMPSNILGSTGVFFLGGLLPAIGYLLYSSVKSVIKNLTITDKKGIVDKLFNIRTPGYITPTEDELHKEMGSESLSSEAVKEHIFNPKNEIFSSLKIQSSKNIISELHKIKLDIKSLSRSINKIYTLLYTSPLFTPTNNIYNLISTTTNIILNNIYNLISTTTNIILNNIYSSLSDLYNLISSDFLGPILDNQQKQLNVLDNINENIIKIQEYIKTLNFPSPPTNQEQKKSQIIQFPVPPPTFPGAAGARLKLKEISHSDDYNNLIHRFPRRASGGDVEKDKIYTVGEKGPELLLPYDKGKILNEKQSENFIGKFFSKKVFTILKDFFSSISKSSQNRNMQMEMEEEKQEEERKENKDFKLQITDKQKGYLPQIINLLKDLKKIGGGKEGGGGRDKNSKSLFDTIFSSNIFKLIVAGVGVAAGTAAIGSLKEKIKKLFGKEKTIRELNLETGKIEEKKEYIETPESEAITSGVAGVGLGITKNVAKAGFGNVVTKGMLGVSNAISKTETLSKAAPIIEKIIPALTKMTPALNLASKGISKILPFVGAGIGTALAAGRLLKGDIVGAAGEFASGILPTVFPVAGTAASLGITGWLYHRDKKIEEFEEERKKFSPNVAKIIGNNPEKFEELKKDKKIIFSKDLNMWIIPNEEKELKKKVINQEQERKTEKPDLIKQEQEQKYERETEKPDLIKQEQEQIPGKIRYTFDSTATKSKLKHIVSEKIVQASQMSPDEFKQKVKQKLSSDILLSRAANILNMPEDELRDSIEKFDKETGLSKAANKFLDTTKETSSRAYNFIKQLVTSPETKAAAVKTLVAGGKSLAWLLDLLSKTPDVVEDELDEFLNSPVNPMLDTPEMKEKRQKEREEKRLERKRKFIEDENIKSKIEASSSNYIKPQMGKINIESLKVIDSTLYPQSETEKVEEKTKPKEKKLEVKTPVTSTFTASVKPVSKTITTPAVPTNIIPSPQPTLNMVNTGTIIPELSSYNNDYINNIINGIFSNTVIIFQESFKMFALGQTKYLALR